MKRIRMLTNATIAVVLALLGVATSFAQDKYAVKVPDGLAFSEFRGYETWEVVSISYSEPLIAVVVANPAMIEAYKAGAPANGKPFPDGAKMAKIHWNAKKSADAPAPTVVPGTLHDVDVMVRDSKRFAASGNWGYGEFDYDAASGTFKPQQQNGAGCGFACHTIVKSKDYVFTAFPNR